MFRTGYGRNVLLPVLGMLSGLVLVIQTVFFLCAAFFLGLSRMNSSPLSFHDRFGLAVFSSTLPALASSLFGLFLPTVHVIVFYFIVIFIIFQRSALCPPWLDSLS
jgi:maltodextrin utilization protein YvdJ